MKAASAARRRKEINILTAAAVSKRGANSAAEMLIEAELQLRCTGVQEGTAVVVPIDLDKRQ